MRKLADALRDTIAANPLLEMGISDKLFNLTRLAEFIRPLLETRLQKTVRRSSVTMALSRLQARYQRIAPHARREFFVDKISVFANLATQTFAKTPQTHAQITAVYGKAFDRGYFAFSESTSEITVFYDRQLAPLVTAALTAAPKYKNTQVSAIAVTFSEELFTATGLLSLLMQKLNLQGINVIEISSTYTEIIFYLDDSDLRLAFNTLHRSFMRGIS